MSHMSIWRPDFTTLKLFVAVCDEASIAKAAERESIVASAVSKRISELEASLGATLLVRGGRGVTPTAAGQALLLKARRILESVDDLQSEIGEYVEGVRGRVRVLANISSMVGHLPRDIGAFMASHPNLQVDLIERVSSAVAQGVRDDEGDIGICLSIVDLWGLRHQHYCSDELVLVAHPQHPLAQQPQVRFDDVMPHDLIGLQTTSRMTTFLAGLAARQGRELRYRAYVSTYEAACHLIRERVGVSVLSAEAVKIPSAALGLVTVPFVEPWSKREIVACVREDRAPSEAAAKLLAFLHERQMP